MDNNQPSDSSGSTNPFSTVVSGMLRGNKSTQSYQKLEEGDSAPSKNDQTNANVKRQLYDHYVSRKRLLRTGFSRLFVTFFFCLLVALSVRAYQGFDGDNPRVLRRSEVSTMNWILLVLLLGLGLNIASSLRHYSDNLRWALLARKWVSLGEFDLILGCGSLVNVLKLMIISFPGSEKLPVVWRLSHFEKTYHKIAQKSSSRYTSILCMIWLLINIGAQILVAALSFFWPVDPSLMNPLTTHGTVSIADVAKFDSLADTMKVTTARASANIYGITGLEYPVFDFPLNVSKQELSAQYRTVIYKGNGFYEYTFLNRNSDQPNAQYLVSSRNIRTTSECAPVLTEPTSQAPINSTVRYFNNGKWWKYYLSRSIQGHISWNADANRRCGPRCLQIVAYQRADPELGIVSNSMFLCNSTVSPVEESNEFTNLKDEHKPHIYATDVFAQTAAGSIGWTSWKKPNRTVQTQNYAFGSHNSPDQLVNRQDVEEIISRFTIGAIAAFDDHGPRYNIPNQSNRPVIGLLVNPDWPWIFTLLGGICALQLGALIMLLARANKAIIRDDSAFSLARLLAPVVGRIPESEGTNMTGDDIMMHEELLGQKIRYDYEEIEPGLRKVAVRIKPQELSETSSFRSFPKGMYQK